MTRHAVVIAGGGPTGLMLAAELALAGVDVAIVERRAGQDLAASRSRGLLSRTIEVFDQRGIADRFLAEGTVVGVWGDFAGVQLGIGDFPTRHNYVLALAQPDTCSNPVTSRPRWIVTPSSSTQPARIRSARYVTKVRSVTPLGDRTALLHAVVGMVPPVLRERPGQVAQATRRAGQLDVMGVVARLDDLASAYAKHVDRRRAVIPASARDRVAELDHHDLRVTPR